MHGKLGCYKEREREEIPGQRDMSSLGVDVEGYGPVVNNLKI